MALPGQDRFGYAVSELMQRMQIYGTYVLGVYVLPDRKITLSWPRGVRGRLTTAI